jgi:hypothetical protein
MSSLSWSGSMSYLCQAEQKVEGQVVDTSDIVAISKNHHVEITELMIRVSRSGDVELRDRGDAYLVYRPGSVGHGDILLLHLL